MMRTQAKVEGLTYRQWDFLQRNLKTSYDIPADETPVCVVFELNMAEIRHVQMPAIEFATITVALGRVEQDEGIKPTLPTADEVRNLTAEQAVDLAREKNRR